MVEKLIFDALTEEAPIALDDQNTWPRNARNLLDARFELLQSAETASATQDALIEQIGAMVKHRNIIGYQATRLHPEEIATLQSGELRPLTSEFLRERVERRSAAGDLRPEIAKCVLEKNLSRDQRSRAGLVHLLLTNDIPDTFWKFFRYWGGEALYLRHIHNREIEQALRSVGRPCIVEVTIPISALSPDKAAEGMIFFYLSHRNVAGIREAGTNDAIKVPARVLRVIQHGSKDFQDLTGDISWRWPIHT